jgi:hypothetical protein
MPRSTLVIFLAALLVLAGNYFAFGQEPPSQAQAPVAVKAEVTPEPEAEFIPAGEVVSVDPAKNEVVVKHLDFNTDQEQETRICADEKTVFENIKSLAQVKPKDALTIDYIVDAQGRNLATNITLEPPEAMPVSEEKSALPQAEDSAAAPNEAAPQEKAAGQ